MAPDLSKYISYLKYEKNQSALTLEAYCRDIGQFFDWLEERRPEVNIQNITGKDIRNWLAKLATEGISSKTIRRKAQALRSVFKFWIKQGDVSVNPTIDLILPKLPKPLPDFIPEAEMNKILTADESEFKIDGEISPEEKESILREKLIMEILYTLGIRRAELIALNDEDINFYSQEIKVTGKRSKQRVIPVAGSLLKLISEWQNIRDLNYRVCEENGHPLITYKKKRITPPVVHRIVKLKLAPTSAHKKSPHALRHSFATSMLNNGADLNSVKEFLGHASLATTQIYTHVSFAEIKKNYNKAHPRSSKK